MASMDQQPPQPQQEQQQAEDLVSARRGKRKSGNDNDNNNRNNPAASAAAHLGKKRLAVMVRDAASLLTANDICDGVYNSDEEPPAKEISQEYLRWRLEENHDEQEEEDSLSDWTIQIVTTTTTATTTSSTSSPPSAAARAAAGSAVHDGQEANNDDVFVVKTYHVHKYVLATGPRRCEYFVRLFQQGGRFAESQNSTSRIELDELAANAFPLLLDFLYAPPHVADTMIPFTTQNATALYSLAKYFEIQRLQWLAKQFWKSDIMSIETCGIYYEHAKILQQDVVLHAASLACAKYILEIPTGPTTAASVSITGRRYLLDTQFWQDYLSTTTANTNMMTQELSLHLSLLLVEYFRETPDIVTLAQFHDFTSDSHLPHIHVNAALHLMDMELELLLLFGAAAAAAAAYDDAGSSSQQQQQHVMAATMTTTANKFSNLQERCIQALAQKWDCIDLDEEPHKILLQKHNVIVQSKIYTSCLAAAKLTKQELVASCQDKQEQIHRLEGSSTSSEQRGGGRGSRYVVLPERRGPGVGRFVRGAALRAEMAAARPAIRFGLAEVAAAAVPPPPPPPPARPAIRFGIADVAVAAPPPARPAAGRFYVAVAPRPARPARAAAAAAAQPAQPPSQRRRRRHRPNDEVVDIDDDDEVVELVFQHRDPISGVPFRMDDDHFHDYANGGGDGDGADDFDDDFF